MSRTSHAEHPPCIATHHTVPWPERPSNAACKAANPQLSEVMEGLGAPKSAALTSQPSSTHYCTFLLEDPLPLVVVLCIVTVSGKAETGHMSYRVMGFQNESDSGHKGDTEGGGSPLPR